MHLGLHSYTAAIEAADLALDLSDDVPDLATTRLSAHLTSGLAHYYAQNMDQSLEMFKSALTESEENPDVVCLLSQVLWAKGGEAERDVARDQLFACIDANPEHLGAVLLLGTIAVLDNAPDVIDAVLEPLHAFRARDDLHRDVAEKVDDLLAAIAQLADGDPIAAAVSAVWMRPAVSEGWGRLARVAEDAFAAETALRVADASDGCERLAEAYGGMATVGCGLRAVFLAPWRTEGWRALGGDLVV